MSAPLPFVRPGLPEPYAFSVTQRPHRAKLDQNEAALDVPEELKRQLAEQLIARPWNRYVQPAQYAEAKAALAAEFGLASDRVALTVGADQAIEAAFAVAGGPGRRARWFEPTYPYIAQAARRTHTIAEPVTADITAETVCAGLPDLVVLVAPNNPTGDSPSDAVVEAALSRQDSLVLIDEAYAEFSPDNRLELLDRHPNLLIARSLSKSLLAGAHVGFVAGLPDVIAIVENLFTAPYHLDAFQLIVAKNYSRLRPHVTAAAKIVVSERQRVFAELAGIDGISPRPSAANFVLFSVRGGAGRAAAVHEALADSGVRIRNVGGLPGLSDGLRVTIGTPKQNELFISCLRDAVASVPS